MEVTGEAGGGMVKVTLNGRHEARRVQIDPAVPIDDREMIEDLVAAAINDAVHRIERQVAHEVVAEVDVRPRNVVVLGPGTIPKTPSGKLRRANSVALVT